MPRSLSELARLTGVAVEGDGTVEISRVATLESAGPGTIAFLARTKYRKQLATTNASAVIVAPAMAADTSLPKLLSPNPYATFAKVAAILHPTPAVEPGCHPSAILDPGAQIASSASIGPRAIIGAHTVIGERASVGASCVVGAGVTLGDDVVLHPNVTIYDRCVIGARTVVHSGAVIGADGFGMAQEEGRWIKIPQIGRVVIGEDVEIGANTTIDRGAIDDTVIENDVKLDNQIQVGHNCRIGAHSAVAGCTGIAGSTTIGRRVRIGGAANIGGHLTIADGVVIAGATTVIGNVREPGIYMGVFPLMPQDDWRRAAVEVRRLRMLSSRVAELERVLQAQQASEGGTE